MIVFPVERLCGVRRFTVNALGGADTIVVDNLSGTAATSEDLNLAVAGGAGDGQADTVIVTYMDW